MKGDASKLYTCTSAGQVLPPIMKKCFHFQSLYEFHSYRKEVLDFKVTHLLGGRMTALVAVKLSRTLWGSWARKPFLFLVCRE